MSGWLLITQIALSNLLRASRKVSLNSCGGDVGFS